MHFSRLAHLFLLTILAFKISRWMFWQPAFRNFRAKLKKLQFFLFFSLSPPTPPPRCFSFSAYISLRWNKEASRDHARFSLSRHPLRWNLHSESRLSVSLSHVNSVLTSYNRTYKVYSRLYLVFFSSLTLAFMEVGKIIIRKPHSKQKSPDVKSFAGLSRLLGSRDSIHGRENYDYRQAFESDLH